MKWTLRSKIRASFGIALALLLVVDTVALINVRRLTHTVHGQVHTYEVLHDLDELLSFLQDAETGQRGYLLTGEEHYLEPYRVSVVAVREDFRDLRTLTADNPSHQGRLALLEPLVEQKLVELETTIDLRTTRGLDAALTVVSTDEGKHTMDAIRVAIADLKQAETKQLIERERLAAAGSRRATAIIIVGSILGFALLAAALVIIRRDVQRRRAAEDELRRAHDFLEVRVAERTGELSNVNQHLRAEIEQRTRAEAKLEETMRQLEERRDDLLSILDQLDVAAAITDARGCVTFLSRAAWHGYGKRPEEFVGKRWEELFPFCEEDKVRIYALMARPVSERSRASVHLEVTPGRQYWMEIEIQDDPREPQRKIFFFHDVTAVYDLRRQLGEKVQFHDLVGKSEAAQKTYQQIQQLAAVDSTVLIEGETGTGKELAARAIHQHSHRCERAFVAVNVAGLANSLLSSQLFGHKRGAFTGAVTDHVGFFEAADGGTIFLDEVGDMPGEVQTALLRVLQEREVVRLGENKPRKVDVRVLAATQHDLVRAVELGRFRSDLLYRIRVGRVRLPPLRDRREDIPLLVAHFLGQCRAATGKQLEDISHEAMAILLDHPWPGNVRELKSAVEFASIRCGDSVIQASDLPPEILDAEPRPLVTSGNPKDERRLFLEALAHTGGNRTEAARLLGISRATFYRHLSNLGIHSTEGETGSTST